jgi:hypothetical protein
MRIVLFLLAVTQNRVELKGTKKKGRNFAAFPLRRQARPASQ